MDINQTLLLGLSGVCFVLLLIAKFSGNKNIDIPLGVAAIIFFGFIFYLVPNQILTFFDLSFTTKSILGIVWWTCAAFLVNALVKKFVYRLHLTPDGESTVPKILQHLVTAFIYLVAAMIVMRFVLHHSITAVATASGAIALILGYSSRTVFEEIFSGLALSANKPFVKGDLIQLNGEWAYVKDISWRSITYEDMDNNYVIVPNTVVAASKIRNLDNPTKGTRRTMYFRTEYNAPPELVIAECNKAMSECPHIKPHPWNFTSFYEFDEYGMKYKLHFHIHHYDDWYVGSDELINAMWYRFARKGIRFAHQRHLNYKNPEDENRGIMGSAYNESSWRDLVEQFGQVPMFEGMTKADMKELAKSATMRVLGPPEKIIEAGSTNTSMYIIAYGTAEVYEVDEHGRETYMASVGATESIGLMSLLIGAPQRTTIRAKEELGVWEISSDSLHELFEKKPEIMEYIAKNVARWQMEEDEAINAIATSRSEAERALKKHTSTLSDRIVKFFDGRNDDDDDNNIEFKNY